MRLPDGSVLMHGSAPYDPVKAHAYYIRTRQLKGRKPGAKKTSSGDRMKKVDTFTVSTDKGKVKLTAQQLSEQRAYAAERVASIKKRLSRLQSELRKKIAEAKKAERDAKKKPTASEKAKAARDSKKYRDKHKQELKTKARREAKKEKPKADSVEGLTKTIEGVQRSLKAAVERQRQLNSATKNG